MALLSLQCLERIKIGLEVCCSEVNVRAGMFLVNYKNVVQLENVSRGETFSSALPELAHNGSGRAFSRKSHIE
jgi:hypothetical protein